MVEAQILIDKTNMHGQRKHQLNKQNKSKEGIRDNSWEETQNVIEQFEGIIPTIANIDTAKKMNFNFAHEENGDGEIEASRTGIANTLAKFKIFARHRVAHLKRRTAFGEVQDFVISCACCLSVAHFMFDLRILGAQASLRFQWRAARQRFVVTQSSAMSMHIPPSFTTACCKSVPTFFPALN